MSRLTTNKQLTGKTILLITPSMAALAFLIGLSKALHKAGANVHLVCSSNGFTDVQVPDYIQYHDVSMPRGANLLQHIQAANILKRIVNDIKPDLIDVHYSAAMVTTAISRRNNWPPVIATVQGLRFPHTKGFLSGLIDKVAELGAALRMDQVTVLTKCDLLATKPYKTGKFRLQESLGFGCDLNRFDPQRFSETCKLELRKALRIAPNNVVCIYVGRYVKFKGFDIALRAFREANLKNKGMSLLLCGTPDALHPSGVSSDELLSATADPNIIDIGWAADIERYLSISDICIFPSEREGVPVSLMEALAMGVPVITSDSRGCRDVVRNDVDGIVLPIRDTSRYAAKLSELVNDIHTLKRMSREARYGRERFDATKFANESMNQYATHMLSRV